VLSADSLPPDAAPSQFVHYAFASFSAGTSRDAVAGLPQRLLAEGTLAFVGHYGQVWSCLFLESLAALSPTRVVDFYSEMVLKLGTSVLVRQAVRGLLSSGERYAAGLATDADLSTDQTTVSAQSLAHRWTAMNNARRAVVLGDPAVHL